MKKIKFLQIIALCLTLSSCESCKEEEWDTLPPETQKGANTFGCYVNGELFVKEKEAPFFAPLCLSAEYDQSDKVLSVYCKGRDKMGTITLRVLNPVVGIRQVPLLAELSKMIILKEETGADNITIQYVDDVTYDMIENTGEIILTKLDTVNCIVSGRFQFQGQYYGRSLSIIGDSIVFVTNGRFDTKIIPVLSYQLHFFGNFVK